MIIIIIISISESTPTRKRKRHPENWKQNKRQQKVQRGEEYTGAKGRIHAARSMKENCSCKRDCKELIGDDKRQSLFKTYWSLDSKSKNSFIAQHVVFSKTARKTSKKQESRRQYSYKYYFSSINGKDEVCQQFFIKTLGISQKKVHYYFKNLHNNHDGVSYSPLKGRHEKNKISEERLQLVRNHINSFGRIPGHYVRATSQKEYLSRELNLNKMYSLYKTSDEVTDPVKFWKYEQIFNNEFNLSFHKPKKDLCNKCVFYETKIKNGECLTTKEEDEKQRHLQDKIKSKEIKAYDKNNHDDETIVLIFDLQNIFALPKANVGLFFYKRKYISFNFTAHCLNNKKTYCSFWHEQINGRSGNNIASALMAILNNVKLDFPTMKKIILWSDSCVAQNRNSIMSTAILDFLKRNPSITTIEQKYSTPGHSLLQEVDAVHSAIENWLRETEIFSPLGLLRQLAKINYKNINLKIIQLKSNDFKDFKTASNQYQFSKMPFTKIKCIQYNAESFPKVLFKTCFENDSFENVSIKKVIRKQKKTKKCKKNPEVFDENNLPPIQIENFSYEITAAKKTDLLDQMKYMPIQDQGFYRAILNIENEQ